jgi:multidrug efflux pump subunit AcrB
VVNQELLKVAQIFAETVVIVLAVVVLFLGWRAGLVTGLIVPLTVFATLIVMRMLQIELHMVSIAAIIISLGIFVDNAIVIVEDYQRRLHDGEDKASAAEAAGRTMAAPLLISSLAVIFAFAPLVMGASESAEYMRSLAIVLAATLLVSLFLALTVTVVTAQLFAGHADHEKEERGVIAKVRRWYADHVRWVLRRPIAVVGSMAGLLAASLAISALLPQELFSPSNRSQAQILVELPPGASSRETYALAEAVTERLAVDDAKRHGPARLDGDPPEHQRPDAFDSRLDVILLAGRDTARGQHQVALPCGLPQPQREFALPVPEDTKVDGIGTCALHQRQKHDPVGIVDACFGQRVSRLDQFIAGREHADLQLAAH